MNQNRSQMASYYGRLVEEYAARKMNLSIDHTQVRGTRVDVRDDFGRPGDVKGAMSNRSTGGPGRYRLWKDQHDVLTADGGFYVFVWYRAVEGGIRVRAIKKVPASAVRVQWGGSGSHRRDSQQAKILARSVFE